MTNDEKDNYTYVCSMIEYTARKTKNRRGVIVEKMQEQGIQKQLQDASVNCYRSCKQVCADWIEIYQIPTGEFDTISNCKYDIPDFVTIGKLYCILIEECAPKGEEVREMINIFSSFISDEISDFKTGIYCENPDYLKWSYREGYLLD